MSTRIKQTQPNELTVNGKRVYRNAEGKWITTEILTDAEAKAFKMHITEIKKPVNIKSISKYWREQSNHVER